MRTAAILTAIATRFDAELTRRFDGLLPFIVEGSPAGWLSAERAALLAGFAELAVESGSVRFADGIAGVEARTRALDRVARDLARGGHLSAWRNERYAIRASFDARPWFYLERAAARFFGVHTHSVHANGIVEHENGHALWFARRSPQKPIDPGQFDTLVGGGIAGCDSVEDSLLREAWEEAGLPADLVGRARAAGGLDVIHTGIDGLQHETIHVFDLPVPASFVPDNQDGEAVEHRLLGANDALELIGSGKTTLDCALISIDCLVRCDGFALDAGHRPALAQLCRRGAGELSPRPP